MVNQAPITGENMPVEKIRGDSLYAGSINASGSLEFVVTAPATESTLARIMHVVEKARESCAPVQRHMNTFAKYYTPAVFLLALMVGIIPPFVCRQHGYRPSIRHWSCWSLVVPVRLSLLRPSVLSVAWRQQHAMAY